MNARVVNLKSSKYNVYIGRGSKWGNPYLIGVDGTREEVLKKYHTYLLSNRYLMASLPELNGKILGCFCKPLSCHGDILIEELNKLEELK